ncbi:hypothetical protein [uncultured Tateyamaria sp.]|uniref:hypothetical protein n=1 Tax=uncultured Tateyamaria sp. TaxID=455651 RepID=UPI002614BCFE|nr:hypothetical protein [uncultured Tateyamaria sp.]
MSWLSGSFGSTAEHLIELMRHSDTVLAVALEGAGCNEAMTNEYLKRIKKDLADILRTLGAIRAAEGDQTKE